MKRKAFALTLILAILSVAGAQIVHFSSANFFPEPAPQGIRIESDGRVSGTDKIQRNGNVYTLTDNTEGTIVVLRDSIVIDGAGYILHGDKNSTGIFLQDRVNVTIRNMEIRNFYYGVKLTWSNIDTGSRNNTISGNTITGNTVGIELNMFTKNNFVYDNTITNNSYGVIITHSPNNVFKNNLLRDNQFNMWIYVETSVQASNFVNDIDASNTVDGKPIYYWVNQHDKTVPSDAGYVALINCSGITVQNLILANNGQGVLLVATNNSLITKNQMKNNGYGIVVYGIYEPCFNNTITRNEIIGWTKRDIFVWTDLQNSIYDNQVIPVQNTPQPSPNPPSSSHQETEPQPETEPFPTALVAVASAVSAVAVGAVLLAYFKKRRC